MDGTSGSGPTRQRLKAWLALVRAPALGPTTFLRLREAGIDPVAYVGTRALPAGTGLGAAVRGYLASPDWPGVERDLAWLEGPGHHLLTLDDDRYPPLLRELPDPPLALFVRGDPAALVLPQLAIVGSRGPTEGGRRTARAFAAELGAAGLAVTSGLALGIDGAAHEGALDAGAVTVAVAGTGPDRIYPARHRGLADRIAERGAVVSELPVGVAPLPAHFPRRNRIVSGLCAGTLVVEASVKSGSLITARLAAEQGREVFAVPGSIHNPLARGCHQLIRAGAKLVETAGDVLVELGPLLGVAASRTTGRPADSRAAIPPAQQRVLGIMGFDPVSPDELAERSGLPAGEVAGTLLLLELGGWVSCAAGGRYCRLSGAADASSAAAPDAAGSAQ
jgi:DNA processing protein